MGDEEILELYLRRDEAAIAQTLLAHGPYCRRLAENILHSPEDAEECVSDACLRAWNAIPPERPARLRYYLAKITRNLALHRFRAAQAEKRGGGELPLVLEELADCVPGGESPEAEVLARELGAVLSSFTAALPPRERYIFLRRYYSAEPVADIAARCGLSPGNVSVILTRLRKKLRARLSKEGF